jgi:hypothetical protein
LINVEQHGWVGRIAFNQPQALARRLVLYRLISTLRQLAK